MFPKYVLLSICAFIRVHFGRPGKFSQHSPFRCTHIFSKTSYDQWFFSKKSWKSSLFKSMSVFQLDNLFFFFLSFSFVYFFFSFVFCFFLPFFFHEVFFYLNMCIFFWGIFAIYMHILGILLPKHIYILWGIFLLHTCISKVSCYLNIYVLWGMTTFRACACFI